jgi:hypothetical protein
LSFPTDTMTKEEAKSKLREIARVGWIATSTHCRQRMSERNISLEDVENVLLWGEVTEVVWDNKYQSFKLTVHGQDYDEVDLTIIAAFVDQNRILCITVHE